MGIGLKMTELWAINACSYMDMHPYFDLIMYTECPNIIFFGGTFLYDQ